MSKLSKSMLSPEAKNIISLCRALVISQKHPYRVRELEREYNQMEGTPIDWKKFGFKNLEEFFSASGEFVLSKYQGETCITARPTKETAHIVSMVKRQKSNRKKQKINSSAVKNENFVNEGGSDGNDEEDEEAGDNNVSLDQLLHSEITLSDGGRAKLFSRGPKYSEDHWPISCHMCFIGNINGEVELKAHIRSKKHRKFLKRPPIERKYYFRAFHQPFGNNPICPTPLRIFPGEIIMEITPDLVPRIIKRDDWTYKLIPEDATLYDPLTDHSKKSHMMGLGYAFKMKRNDRLIYFCALCRAQFSDEGYQHFSGSKHCDKYIERHFPKAVKRLNRIFLHLDPYYSNPRILKQEKYNRWIFQRIYMKIEKQLGVQHHVKFIDSDDFEMKHSLYAEKARNSNHYDENTIYISDAELERYAKQAIEAMPVAAPRISEKQLKEIASRLKVPIKRKLLQQVASPAAPKKVQRKYERKAFIESPYAWERYRRIIGAIIDLIEDKYDDYIKDPKSHPKYELEWREFLHTRGNELAKANIDPHTYDLNAEWIPYWTRRLQDLQTKEIVKQKIATKHKMNLSPHVRSPSPIRLSNGSRRTDNKRPASQKQTVKRMMPRTREKYSYDEPLTIVSVLRLLSALENQLGCLGPRAVEFLSKAILSEKINPHSDELLMQNDFYIFFMIVKEKLNGQILAGFVEPNMIHAVNEIIHRIASMIDIMDEYRARSSFVGRNMQHSNYPFFGNDGSQYNAGPSNNNNSNQYSGDSQGDNWQSRERREWRTPCGSSTGSSHMDWGYGSNGGGQMNAADNRQFSGGPAGLTRMDNDNRYVQRRDRFDSNNRGPSNRGDLCMDFGSSNQTVYSGGGFDRGCNFIRPNIGRDSNSENQMGNSGGRFIAGCSGSNHPNIAYHQSNNFNDFVGHESRYGMGFDMAKNLFFSRGHNSGRWHD